LGTVVIALELVPASKRLFSSDISQGNTGPPKPCIPEQSHSRPS